MKNKSINKSQTWYIKSGYVWTHEDRWRQCCSTAPEYCTLHVLLADMSFRSPPQSSASCELHDWMDFQLLESLEIPLSVDQEDGQV
jgi:hypothetical protein